MRDRTYAHIKRCRPNPSPPPTIDRVLKQCIDVNAALTVMLAQAAAGMAQMAPRLVDLEHRVARLERGRDPRRKMCE